MYDEVEYFQALQIEYLATDEQFDLQRKGAWVAIQKVGSSAPLEKASTNGIVRKELAPMSPMGAWQRLIRDRSNLETRRSEESFARPGGYAVRKTNLEAAATRYTIGRCTIFDTPRV